MAAPDEHERDIAALRDRTSKLSAAVLRVTASLDESTVLQEIVDSACELTNARYGAITTIDGSGPPRDFVTSGFTPEQHGELEAWLPDGPRLFDHLRELSAPLRLTDLPSYVRSLGLSVDLMPAKTFQGTPMRHRGAHVGSFFLAGKRGGREFSDEDENVLLLFASQAATAIANARTHRNEQRARASLEALVETSPVGVVVFDVSTGAPTTFNREARRLVENLAAPGRPPEELIEILTCRFADGREVPMSRLIHDAPALRAEEVALSVADGRGVRALINATTIRSAGGEPESMVVIMQDLAHLDEVERLRTEFLSMVSHELRAPLTSIKGSAATVLGASDELDRSELLQFFRIVDDQADHMRGLIGDLLDVGRIEAGTLSVAPQPVDLTRLVERARSAFASGGARHAVSIDLPRDLPRVLVLDDDPQALRFARDALASRGYAPVVAGDARELPRLLRTERPDLVLLDLVLPGTDGIELLQRLPELANVPVIFISAYGRDETVARALEAGAEDYIVKPFSPTELTARVGVALRKRLAPGPFVLGELSIDRARRRVTVAGRRVKLTATEYELLRVLSLNAGHVTTYDALLRRVWGGREYAQPQLVRAFVKKLRTKLGDDSSDPTWIFNERGVGYRMPKPGKV